MTAVAHFRGVRKQRGTFLLGIHALLGPNGAGKSTLCPLLAGKSQADIGALAPHALLPGWARFVSPATSH